MWSVKIPTRILAACLCLLLAMPVPGAAQESRSEFLPVGTKARLGRGTIVVMQYSPDGALLAVGSSVGIWLYDAQTREVEALLTSHAEAVDSVAFSPDGRTLASGSGDGSVHLWEVATGTLRYALEGHAGGVGSVAFNPDGRTLASGNWNTVRLWDVATGTLQHT